MDDTQAGAADDQRSETTDTEPLSQATSLVAYALRRTRESAVTCGFLSKDAIAVLKDEQAFGGMESVMRLWKNLAEM